MNIVYKIIFLKRRKNYNFPFYYIGTKSNCQYKNGKIIDNSNNEYYGSSKYPEYKSIVQNNINDIETEILFEGKCYKDCLEKELHFQEKNNVVMSPEYFNLHLATVSTYSNPNYATMKNLKSGKICRVLKEHNDVKSGLWVGVSKNKHWYTNGSESKTFFEGEQPNEWYRGRSSGFLRGKDNPNFGKTYSKEEIEKKSRI